MTLNEKQMQSSFYSAREYLIPGLFFTFFPSASAYFPISCISSAPSGFSAALESFRITIKISGKPTLFLPD